MLQVHELQQLYPFASLPSCSTITLDFTAIAQQCSEQSSQQHTAVALNDAAFADLTAQFSSTGQLAAASAGVKANALRSLSHCLYLTPHQVSTHSCIVMVDHIANP
jgi:hypothetical protein